jgi:hypothetical protein
MCDKAKEKMKKMIAEVKEKLPVVMEKLKGIAQKVKEKAPVYFDKLKKVTMKVVAKIKEKAPIYWEKTKVILQKIKKEAPIYMNKAKEFCKKNPKQVIVGAVIFLVAIVLILASLPSEKKQEITQVKVPTQKVEIKKEVLPIIDKETKVKAVEQKYVYFNFTAQADKDFNYQVFYTVKDEIWYDPKHVVSVTGKAGEQTYKVAIPADKIYRVRLDFDVENEEVTVSNIYLTGEQEADLNNFKDYLFNDIAKKTINKDGSLTVITKEQDPHIGYYIK